MGADFVGHDITAVVKAIKNSTALKEKSEFESTTTFQARRSRFIDQLLFGGVKPTELLAFVVEDSAVAPDFKYNADAQAMAIRLTGYIIRFVLDQDSPALDGVVVRRITQDRDSYIGTNAFGANVKIDRTFIQEFGVAFKQGSWLFPTSDLYSREYSYLLPMPPETAKAVKADLKLLLVCRLTEPWIRESAKGHDPTFSEPYETLVDENYLQVSPVQLWVINDRTGEVLYKLSELSQQEKPGVLHQSVTVSGSN